MPACNSSRLGGQTSRASDSSLHAPGTAQTAASFIAPSVASLSLETRHQDTVYVPCWSLRPQLPERQRGLLEPTAAGRCSQRSPASASLKAPPQVEWGACWPLARRGGSGVGRAPVGRLRVVHGQARVQLGVANLHGAHRLEEAEALAVQQLAQLRRACQGESQPLARAAGQRHTCNCQHFLQSQINTQASANTQELADVLMFVPAATRQRATKRQPPSRKVRPLQKLFPALCQHSCELRHLQLCAGATQRRLHIQPLLGWTSWGLHGLPGAPPWGNTSASMFLRDGVHQETSSAATQVYTPAPRCSSFLSGQPLA